MLEALAVTERSVARPPSVMAIVSLEFVTVMLLDGVPPLRINWPPRLPYVPVTASAIGSAYVPVIVAPSAS